MVVRTLGGYDMLIAKFAWRGNIKRGCILRRPCLRRETEPLAQDLFPVHRVWPTLADSIREGELLFPRLKYPLARHLPRNLD